MTHIQTINTVEATSAPRHYWRNLSIQYLLALVFVGGLEVFWLSPFDWRSFLWAAVLIGVLRANSWFWKKHLSKKYSTLAEAACIFFVFVPLHCFLWMYVFFPIKISKETTFVTKRLENDPQRVDLIGAMEDRFAPSVPVEDNGFRLYIQKTGPIGAGLNDLSKDEQKRQWKEYCEALDLDSNLKPQCGYQTLHIYIDKIEHSRLPDKDRTPEDRKEINQRMSETLNAAKEHPWKAEEYPDVARWIEETRPFYQVIAESVQKPIFYKPYVRQNSEDPGDFLWNRPLSHFITGDISYHIQYHLGNNEAEQAWELVMLLYRYSASQTAYIGSPFMFYFGRYHADSMALHVLRHGDLSSQTIRDYLETIRSFHEPPSQRDWENAVFGERLCRIYNALRFVKSEHPCNFEYMSRLFSWNQELIAMNKQFDAKNDKPVFGKYYFIPQSEIRSYGGLAWLLARKGIFKFIPHGAASGYIRPCLCCPLTFDVDLKRTPTYSTLTEFAFALEIYKRENNGEYPEDLNSLIDFGLSSIPTDPYTDGKPFRCRKNDEGGCVIYSIGPNGIDDNGFEDYNIKADDIAVQMP